MTHTPENITSLKPNQVFIFGSNLLGAHGGGAAKVAADLFGAEAGVGIGVTGQAYAFPTLDEKYEQLSHDELLGHASDLYITILENPTKQFILTKVGCSIAGYDEAYIQRLFVKNLPNLIKPIGWDEVIGYKVFESDWKCRDFQYEIGNTYTHEGIVQVCHRGFHFCYDVADCFNYYSFNRNHKIAKVRGFGSNDVENDKVCFGNIEILEEVSWHSMLQLANEGQGNTGISNSGSSNSGSSNSGSSNSGDSNSGSSNSGSSNSGSSNSGSWNSGYRNSGYRNSGSSNSGDRNSGSSNSGYRNSGSWNSGSSNSGSSNSGSRNSGYRNSGDRNSGDRNSGDSNSGDSNSGDRNSGSWNSGDRNSGYLNTNEPKLRIFNKNTDKNISDIYFPNWMNFELSVWKFERDMTDEEKENNPEYEIIGGYLFSIDYKEAAQLAYDSATAEEKRSVEDIPNYDSDILFEIFGIDRRQK